MIHSLPVLPYTDRALEPVISQATMRLHYEKHLQTYVDNLNKLVVGTPYENLPLTQVVTTAPEGALFNQAGQVLNHTLYFLQLIPHPVQLAPIGELAAAIAHDFGGFNQFKEIFTTASVGLFGSGWTWLSADKEKRLHITQEVNAGNPLRTGKTPLLCFDVWEHAYYLDYHNRRTDYIAALWNIINWQVIAQRFE